MTDADTATTATDGPPVAVNLRAEMERLHLGSEAFAERMRDLGGTRVRERLVRRWRAAEVVPSWPNLERIAEICGREPGWFYADHDDTAEEVAA